LSNISITDIFVTIGI